MRYKKMRKFIIRNFGDEDDETWLTDVVLGQLKKGRIYSMSHHTAEEAPGYVKIGDEKNKVLYLDGDIVMYDGYVYFCTHYA